MNPYTHWEKSDEYKSLVALMLQVRTSDDLQLYEVVAGNTKTGDDKAIKLFLQLTKEIDANAKVAVKNMEYGLQK